MTTIIERYSNRGVEDLDSKDKSFATTLTARDKHYVCIMQQTHDGSSTSIFYPLPLPSPIIATLEHPPPLSLSPIPHPAPMPTTSRRIQCNTSIDCVLLYPLYVWYIVILFVSLTEEATIKAKR